jgi:hypothetical protein
MSEHDNLPNQAMQWMRTVLMPSYGSYNLLLVATRALASRR